jgi:hypothetical protein
MMLNSYVSCSLFFTLQVSHMWQLRWVDINNISSSHLVECFSELQKAGKVPDHQCSFSYSCGFNLNIQIKLTPVNSEQSKIVRHTLYRYGQQQLIANTSWFYRCSVGYHMEQHNDKALSLCLIIYFLEYISSTALTILYVLYCPIVMGFSSWKMGHQGF